MHLCKDGTPDHPPTMPATRYAGIHCAAWSCLTVAGDAGASWRASSLGTSALVCDERLGWHGPLPAWSGDPAALLLACARPAWAAIAGLPGLPAWGLSASKGDPWAWSRALAGQAAALHQAPPHAPGAAVARALGVGLHRPCLVAAACSTGLVACLEAADLIAAGMCSRALAGAVDGDLPPWLHAGFASLGVLCGQRRPQAFAEPTGFAPAAGAGVVALAGRGPWRLVAGVRLGDAGHETHFEDPGVLHHALASLWDAAGRPELIITHGTGTAVGDPYERAGLDAGPWSGVARLSCKPAIGHCLGASGAVELALACEAPVARLWKLSLGFGGHLAAVALERS